MWRYGLDCDPSNTCCPGGRHAYTGDDIGLAPVAAQFTGTLSRRTNPLAIEYNMVVPEHKLSFEYGRLIWFVFENVILPPLTHTNSMEAAIESLFGCVPNPAGGAPLCGCDRVGAWVDAQIHVTGVGGPVCELAVTAISAKFEQELVSLKTSGSDTSYFMMGIEGVLADADLDLRTDKLTGGVSGRLYLDGSTPDFTGELFGDSHRKTCKQDAVCTAYEACRAATDVLDECKGRLVCMPRVGDRVAGQSCSAQSQCKSGVCLGTGATSTCFTTCDQNTDCPASQPPLTCGHGTATITVTTTPAVSLIANACGW